MSRYILSLIAVCSLTIGLSFPPSQVYAAKPSASAKPGNKPEAAKKSKTKKKTKKPLPPPPPVISVPLPPRIPTPAPQPVPPPPPVVPTPPPAPSGPPGALKIDTRDDATVKMRGIEIPAKQVIADIPAGTYKITVKAPGFPPEDRTVEIEPGKTLTLKVDFSYSKTYVSGSSMAAIRVLKPATLATDLHYIINGRNYDALEAQLTSPTGLKFPPAEKVVFVAYKEGIGHMETTFLLPAGSTFDVALAESDGKLKLRNTGALFVDSNPQNAKIIIDKVDSKEKTPFLFKKIEGGMHEVSIEKGGYKPNRKQVPVVPGIGKVTNVSDVTLEPEEGTTPSTDEGDKGKVSEETLLSFAPFSANTPPTGHGSFNFGSGWPWPVNVRFDIGVYRKINTGISVGGEFRSNFFYTTGGANIKFQLGQMGPIAMGFDVYVGGGGGPRSRTTFSAEAGFPITISSAKGGVRFTLRPYIEVYIDQNCPSESELQDFYNAHKNDQDLNAFKTFVDPAAGAGEHPGDRCVGHGSTTNPMAAGVGYRPDTGTLNATGPYYRNSNGTLGDPALSLPGQLPNHGPLDQFVGFRVFLQVALEIQMTKRFGMYAMVDWAPFPAYNAERQAFTDKFNKVAPITDGTDLGIFYGRLGFTVKF